MAKKIKPIAILDIHTTLDISWELKAEIVVALYKCQGIIEALDPSIGCSIEIQKDY